METSDPNLEAIMAAPDFDPGDKDFGS